MLIAAIDSKNIHNQVLKLRKLHWSWFWGQLRNCMPHVHNLEIHRVLLQSEEGCFGGKSKCWGFEFESVGPRCLGIPAISGAKYSGVPQVV